MRYALWSQPRIQPQYIIVHGATSDETALNTAGVLPLPPGIVYQPENWDIYSEDPTARTLICDAQAGQGNTAAEIFDLCPGLRDWKAKLIRNVGEFRLSQLVGHYLPAERETWPYQRDEAMRWKTGGMQNTPYCDAIAAGRGVDREAFLQAVIDNTTTFAAASAAILGQQQAILDRIYSAATVAEVVNEAW